MTTNWKHEYDERGNHQLTNNLTGATSDWQSYKTPAVVQSAEKDRWYVVVTDYFSETDEFPEANHLYMITDMKEDLK